MPRKWSEFLEKAGEKLALVNARRVFNENGGELDDIELLQNDDVLYVSDGGEFREPMRRALNGGVDDIVDVARAVALSELDGGNSSMRLSGVARCRTAPTSPLDTPKRMSLVVSSAVLSDDETALAPASLTSTKTSAAIATTSTTTTTTTTTTTATTTTTTTTTKAASTNGSKLDVVVATPSTSTTTSTSSTPTTTTTTTTTTVNSDTEAAASLPSHGVSFDESDNGAHNNAPTQESSDDVATMSLRKSVRRARRSRPVVVSQDSWVNLNVGGRIFSTTRGTLTAAGDNMLAHMFGSEWQSATDASGAYLIDRSPEYFVPLLNYLRCGRLNLDAGVSPINVLEEARFYGLQVIDWCVCVCVSLQLLVYKHYILIAMITIECCSRIGAIGARCVVRSNVAHTKSELLCCVVLCDVVFIFVCWKLCNHYSTFFFLLRRN